MITDKPFIGLEVEGPIDKQGRLTLFLPKGAVKTVGVDVILREIKAKKYPHVYFGAGECPGVTEEDVILMKKILYPPLCDITIEVDTVSDLMYLPDPALFKKVQIVLVLPFMKDSFKINHIKFVNPHEVNWFVLKDPIITDRKDLRYTLDKCL